MPKQVAIYYVSRCPECVRARDTLARLLAERGVPLEAYDVESDLDARERMIRVSAQAGTPVVVVDRREIVGFDPRRIRHYLGVDVGTEHKAHW